MSVQQNAKATGHYTVRCIGPDGKEKWVEEFDNLVVDEGLNHILNTVLNGDSQVSTWYVGLLEASPSPAAGWTKTEVGAADFVDYDEATLPTWTPDGASSAESISNSSSTADFTISQDSSSIGGAYLASANTKAVEGGAAIIYSAGAFTGGNKPADDNDTLQVTATFTQAAV
jgi:hypothetical protein